MSLAPNNNQNPNSSILQYIPKPLRLLISPWLKVSEIDSVRQDIGILKDRVEAITEKDISRVKENIQHLKEEFQISKKHSEQEVNLLKRELNCQLKEDVSNIKDSIRKIIYEVINDLDRQIQFSNEAEQKEIENRKERLRGALTKIDKAINMLPELEQSLMHTKQAAQWLANNREDLVEITIRKLSAYSSELEKHDAVKLLQQELNQYLEFVCTFLQKGKTLTYIPKNINVKYIHIQAFSLIMKEVIDSEEFTNNIDNKILIKIKRYLKDLIKVVQQTL